MPIKTYDIAIVGGGLAGLCLAIQAAQNGHQVVVFEKEAYPFHKVCGEYISNESRNFLQSLGVPLHQWQVPEIQQLQLTDCAGTSYQFQLPLGGFGISRYKLDDCLFKLALQHGVHVLTKTKVNNVIRYDEEWTIETSGDNFKARLVAGAFGKRSNLDVKWKRQFITGKSVGLNNFIGVKYHVHYPVEKNIIALHNFKDGYCGISAIEDDKACLCYLTTGQNLQRSGNSIQKMEKDILGRNPHLEKIFSDATFLYERPLTISQVSFLPKLQVEDGILFLGDAAGLITPLCGNGMSMAMHASKIAFECINQFFCGNVERREMEMDYRKKWKEAFGKRLWIGRTVQQLFGGETATSLFLGAMHKLPFVAKTIIKSTHGKSF